MWGGLTVADFWTSFADADEHVREIDEALTWASTSLATARECGNGMGELVVRRRLDKLLDTRLELTAEAE